MVLIQSTSQQQGQQQGNKDPILFKTTGKTTLKCTNLSKVFSPPLYYTLICMVIERVNPKTGLLIFCAVAERKFQVNPRNPAKFARNLIKYMSAQHNYLKVILAVGAVYLV